MAKEPSRVIPRIIHQIWFEDSPKPAPKAFLESWYRMAELIGCRYVLHTKQTGWAFSPEILASGPWTRKADILRLEVMWLYGGVYIDADIQNVAPLPDDFFAEPWLVYENEEETTLVGNHAMGLEPGSPLALEALEQIHEGREGIVAFATGPGLLTELLPKYPHRILPARHFGPEYFNGIAAPGDAPVYGRHVWASTRGRYDTLEMPPPIVRDARQDMVHKMRMAALRKAFSPLKDPRS